MGRRPREEPLTLRYHKIADSQDPAWNDWMERGNPSGLITLLPGSTPPWSVAERKARTDEYEKILVRLNARYTEYRDCRVALRAQEHAAQEGTDRTDLATLGKKKYTQDLIAEMLSEEFGFPVSRPRVNRSITDAKAWSQWLVTGNTHSVNGPTRKPDPRSD
jgi:hypothetical protein